MHLNLRHLRDDASTDEARGCASNASNQETFKDAHNACAAHVHALQVMQQYCQCQINRWYVRELRTTVQAYCHVK